MKTIIKKENKKLKSENFYSKLLAELSGVAFRGISFLLIRHLSALESNLRFACHLLLCWRSQCSNFSFSFTAKRFERARNVSRLNLSSSTVRNQSFRLKKRRV